MVDESGACVKMEDKIASLISTQGLVTIDSNDTVKHALKKLAKAGITSAPVLTKIGNHTLFYYKPNNSCS